MTHALIRMVRALYLRIGGTDRTASGLNGDRVVDAADASIQFANRTTMTANVSFVVPEPSMPVISGVALRIPGGGHENWFNPIPKGRPLPRDDTDLACGVVLNSILFNANRTLRSFVVPHGHVEQSDERFPAQSVPGRAQTRTRGRFFGASQPAAGFEELTDR